MKSKTILKNAGKLVAIYARTSKEFKNIERVSIEQQQADARDWIARKAIHGRVECFIDADRSGSLWPRQWTDKVKHREALTALIEAVEAGQVSAVVVRKLDRLARGTELTLRLVRLFESHNVRLLATDEALPGAEDQSGMFTLTVIAAAAEYELKKTRANTRAALQYLKRNGEKYHGAQCFGYRDGPNKTVVKDEAKALLVVEVFRKFIDGESLHRIGLWLTAKTNRRTGWHGEHIRRLLTRSQYIGMKQLDGRLVPCKVYPSIIEPDVFRAAAEELKARRGVKLGAFENRQRKPHLLSGLLTCAACGRNLTWDSRKGEESMPRCKWHTGAPFLMRERYWDSWVEAFFLPLWLVRTDEPNPKRSMLLTQLDDLAIHTKATQTAFGKLKIAPDLMASTLAQISADRERLESELATLPPDDLSPHRMLADMTFTERRQVLLHAIKLVKVATKSVTVEFTEWSGRQPLTFPLMCTKTAGSPLRPRHCLVPENFTHIEARDMLEAGRVDWTAYVNRGDREGALFYQSGGQPVTVEPLIGMKRKHHYEVASGEVLDVDATVFQQLLEFHAKHNRRPTMKDVRRLAKSPSDIASVSSRQICSAVHSVPPPP